MTSTTSSQQPASNIQYEYDDANRLVLSEACPEPCRRVEGLTGVNGQAYTLLSVQRGVKPPVKKAPSTRISATKGTSFQAWSLLKRLTLAYQRALPLNS
jgi:hypothetical protein